MKKGEYEKLTEEEKSALRESLIGAENKASKAKRTNWFSVDFPNPRWKLVPALLGWPIERNEREIKHPHLIITFIIAMCLFYFGSVQLDLKLVTGAWGFVPSDWSRQGFLTLLSSFFLHGSFLHLLGNCYYFYFFGDDVEDELGLMPFVLLLAGSHIAGMGLHGFFTSDPSIPVVGASAGISGLLGYYMWSFPRRQISHMVFFLFVSCIWLHVPAVFTFGWKLFIEFVSAAYMGSSSPVAFWAHIGGMIFGLLFAVICKQLDAAKF